MDKKISRLRSRIEATKKNAAGRRVFDERVRAAVVELTREWAQAGKPRVELGRRLGLRESTISWWLKRDSKRRKATPKVMPVEIVEDAGPSSALMIVLPGGARVEGLTVDDVAELVRKLG